MTDRSALPLDPLPPRRILLVDNQPLFRDGLAHRLAAAPDLALVGQAAGLADGVPLLDVVAPDLVVLDLALADGSGLDLLAHRGRTGSPARALVVSGLDEAGYAPAAAEAGASGFVGKHEPAEVVLAAARQVLAGRTYFSAAALSRLLAGGDGGPTPGVGRLSPRERQVFDLLGDGLTAKQIAARLGMSVHTVDTHRERIKRKLKLPTGAAMNRLAVEWKVRLQLRPDRNLSSGPPQGRGESGVHSAAAIPDGRLLAAR